MYENAYDIRNFTDYVFGFSSISWTNNASYPAYLGDSRFTANTDGRGFGDIIFDVYYDSVQMPYVVSLVEASKMEAVHNAVNDWADALSAQLNSQRQAISVARANAQKMEVNGDDIIDDKDPYVDLWDAADKIAGQGIAVAESTALKSAIETAVVRVNYQPANDQVDWDYSNAHGLTIYWPRSAYGPTAYGDYVKGDLYTFSDTGAWDEFLAAYAGESARNGMGTTLGAVERRIAPDPTNGQYQVYLPLVVR